MTGDARPLCPRPGKRRTSEGMALGGVTGKRFRGWRDCAGLVESGQQPNHGVLTGLRHSGILAPFMVDQPARSRAAIAATSASTFDKRRCAARPLFLPFNRCPRALWLPPSPPDGRGSCRKQWHVPPGRV